MKLKDLTGAILFALLTIVALIVGIITENKNVMLACYSFIIMSLVAYAIAYLKAIKKEVADIKQILTNKE